MSDSTQISDQLNLRLLVCQERGWYVAQGLELDVASQGRSMPEARKAFAKTLFSQLAAYVDQGENPFNQIGPAPERYWQCFEDSPCLTTESYTVLTPEAPSSLLTYRSVRVCEERFGTLREQSEPDRCRGETDGADQLPVAAVIHRLETDNARLRERVDLLEREAAGRPQELPARLSQLSEMVVQENEGNAARELAVRALGRELSCFVTDGSVIDLARNELVLLPYRQLLIVILYFGFDGRGPRTGAQVARMLGRSEAGISRNIREALESIRRHTEEKPEK